MSLQAELNLAEKQCELAYAAKQKAHWRYKKSRNELSKAVLARNSAWEKLQAAMSEPEYYRGKNLSAIKRQYETCTSVLEAAREKKIEAANRLEKAEQNFKQALLAKRRLVKFINKVQARSRT